MKILGFTTLGLILTLAASAQTPRVLITHKGVTQPLSIELMEVESHLKAGFSETTITLKFKNHTNRRQEGEYILPLPDDAEVSGYALEVNGKLRPAVSVEKKRARRAYEEIKARNIDPGIVEKQSDGTYRTRIFPIEPQSTKRVRISYLRPLAHIDDENDEYRMNIDVPANVADYIHRIVGESEGIREVSSIEGLEFQNGKAQKSSTSLKGELIVKLQKSGVVFSRQAKFDYGVIRTAFPEFKPMERAKAKKIQLVWDVSGSGFSRNHEKERAFLFAWLKEQGDCELRFLRARNEILEEEVYQVRDGKNEALLKTLKNLSYDGASSLSGLKPWGDCTVYVGDGLLTDAAQLKDFNHPFYVMSGRKVSVLHEVARVTGGAVIDVTQEVEGQLKKWLQEPLRIESLGDGVDCTMEWKTENRVLLFIKRSHRENEVATIRFYQGTELLAEKRFPVTSLPNERIPMRAWAIGKLRQLVKEGTKHEVMQHAREHVLVTEWTSLIVLERFADHLSYRIPPPEPDLREKYERIIKRRQANQNIADFWREHLNFHQTNFVWLERGLLPRYYQVGSWLTAMEKSFSEKELKQTTYGEINHWHREVAELMQKKEQVDTRAKQKKYERDIVELLGAGKKLVNLSGVKLPEGESYAVAVNGFVETKGKLLMKSKSTLQDAVKKSGGRNVAAAQSLIDLYRNAVKKRYHTLSREYQRVTLKPGDLIVVPDREEESWLMEGDLMLDPFADTPPPEPLDFKSQPAVVITPEVYRGLIFETLAGRAASVDPFGGGGGDRDGSVITVSGGQEIAKGSTEDVMQSGDPWKQYLIETKKGRHSEAFYIDCARFFFQHNQPSQGAQVLSNLIEIHDGDEESYFAVAMWLREFGELDRARLVIQKAIQRADHPPNELLRYFEALLFEGEKAAEKYAEYLSGQGDNLLIRMAVIENWNHLKIDPSHLPKLSHHEKLDWGVRYEVIASDTSALKEMNVVDATGISWPRHESSFSGGLIRNKNGYHHALIKRAIPGKHQIILKANRTTTVTLIRHIDWGTPSQQSVMKTILLKSGQEVVDHFEYELPEE